MPRPDQAVDKMVYQHPSWDADTPIRTETRTTYDTNADGKTDTLVIQNEEKGKTRTLITTYEDGSLHPGRIDARNVQGGDRKEMLVDRDGNGTIDFHSERISDLSDHYEVMDNEDNNLDGLVDRRTLRSGVLYDGRESVVLGSVELEDTNHDGTFDKKTTASRLLLLNGRLQEWEPHTNGILVNPTHLTKEEGIDFPLTTLPKSDEE